MDSGTSSALPYGAITAELATLYEVHALSLLDSEEELARELVAKATRLFGTRYLALLQGRGAEQRLLASWGFRNRGDLLKKMMTARPNQFHLSLGRDGQLGQLYMEQADPLTARERRLYTAFAASVQEALQRLQQSRARVRADQALRESEARYRSLVQALPLSVMLHDMQQILFLNREALRLVGAPDFPTPASPIPATALPQPYLAAALRLLQAPDSADPAGATLECAWPCPDGPQRDIEATLTVVDLQGRRAIQAVLHDVTARKRSESEMRRLAAAMEQAGEGMAVADPEGILVYANRAFLAAIDRARQDVVGRRAAFLKNSDLWTTLYGYGPQGAAHPAWAGELPIENAAGQVTPFPAVVTPVRDAEGRLVNIVIVLRGAGGSP